MTSTYHDDDSMMQKNDSVVMCVPTEITIRHDGPEKASYLTGMAFYKQGQVCPILLLQQDIDGEMLHRVYTQDKTDFVDLRGREALGQFCKGLFEYDQTLRFKVVSSLL